MPLPAFYRRRLAPAAILAVLAGWPFLGPAQEPLPANVAAVLKGHTDAVYAVAFTPDGKSVVTASFDKTLKAWDALSGKEFRTFGGPQGHQGLVVALDISRDGTQLASGGADNFAKVWDYPALTPVREYAGKDAFNAVAVTADGLKAAGAGKDGLVKVWTTADGKEVLSLAGHAGAVAGVSFSPNGQLLVSAGADRTLRFWNVADGKSLAVVGAHSGPITGVLVSPAGNLVFSGSEDGTVKFWNAAPAASRDLAAAHGDAVTALALSTDQSVLATAALDKQVRLWNVANGQLTRPLTGPAAAVTSVAYAPSSALVAAGTADQHLFLWNPADGKEVARALAHAGPVTAVSFHPTAPQLLTAGGDGLVKFWAVPVATRVLTHPEAVLSLAATADGKRLYTGCGDKTVRGWNPAAPQAPDKSVADTSAVSAVAVKGDGTLVAGAGDDVIRLWNPADGKAAGDIGAHAGSVTALGFNPTGTQLLSASVDGSVKLWTLPLTPMRPFAHPDAATCVALTADGTGLFTGAADKQARLWNVQTGQLTRPFAVGGPVVEVAVNPAGTALAVAAADKTLTLFNVADGKELKKLPLPVNAAAYSPDGKSLVAGLADNGLKLLDAADGKEVKNLAGHAGAVTTVAFSPKGDQVVSGSLDKTVQVWSVADGTSKIKFDHGAAVSALAISKDGTKLASGGADKSVKLWGLADGKALGTIATPADVKGVSFHPDGTRLVVAGADNRVRVYGLDGKLLEFFAHDGPVTGVAYHPDGKRLFSASADKSVRQWTPALAAFFQAGGPVRQALYSPKADRVVFAGDDKSVHVYTLADGKLVKTIAAHDGPVTGLAVNGDGSRILSGGDRSLKLWTMPAAATAPEEKPLTFALAGPVTAAAFSPDGKRVAGAAVEDKVGKVQVFDVAAGREVQTFADHAGEVKALAFLADNRTLVSAGVDKTVRLSDVAVLGVLDAHAGGVTSATYSGTGTQALTTGADKTAKQWDLATGKMIRAFGPFPDPVPAAAFSRDSTLAAVAAGKVVKVYSAADGKEALTLTHPADVLSVSFSQDKTKLVTGAADNLARVWDLTTGQELQFFAQAGPVKGVVFHTNNATVLAAGDKTVGIHALAIARVVPTGAPVTALAATPTGSHVLSGGGDKSVKLFNAATGALEKQFPGAEGAVKAVAVAKNNVTLAAAGADATVRVYTLADAKQLGAFKAPAAVDSLAFSPNNLVLAGACQGGAVPTWNVAFTPGQPLPPEFGRLGQVFQHAGPAHDVAFAPDNVHLYSAGDDKAVKVWKVAAEAPTKQFQHPGVVHAVAFNAAGTVLATGCQDGKLRLFDLPKAALLKEVVAHTSPGPMGQPPVGESIYCVAWSPDNKLIATGSREHSVKLWDAATGALVREIKGYKEKEADSGHRDAVYCLAFSPDGKLLATGSNDRTVRLWNVADGSFVRELVNPQLKVRPGSPPLSHPSAVYGVRFTSDGKRLVSAGGAPRGGGSLAVWNVADGALLSAEELPLSTFYGLALAPDDRTAAVGTAGHGGIGGAEVNSSYLFKLPPPK